MAHTTIAFSESQTANTGALIAALADPHVAVSADDVTVPELNKVIAAAGIGADSGLTQLRMESPSLAGRDYFDVCPFSIATNLLTANMPEVLDLTDNPLELVRGEKLNVRQVDDNSATRGTLVALLATGKPSPYVGGNVITVRATNGSTLGASVWTNGALTLSQALPKGKYAIVGAKGISAGLQAFRFVIPGQTWRPGGFGTATLSAMSYPKQRYGGLGIWGEFDTDGLPTVDFLSISADTAQVIYMDLIKVG